MGFDWYISPEHYSIALQNGISAKTLEKRVRDYAWSIKRAITEPIQIHKKWGKWGKVAESNGICPTTFSTRINALGWSMEKAATTPAMTNEEWGKLRAMENRIYPKKYEELAKKNGISKDAFGARLRKGLTLEEAATRPIMTKADASALAYRRDFKFGKALRA